VVCSDFEGFPYGAYFCTDVYIACSPFPPDPYYTYAIPLYQSPAYAWMPMVCGAASRFAVLGGSVRCGCAPSGPLKKVAVPCVLRISWLPGNCLPLAVVHFFLPYWRATERRSPIFWASDGAVDVIFVARFLLFRIRRERRTRAIDAPPSFVHGNLAGSGRRFA